MDSIYGYQVTNVESQMRNTSSVLHWTRRMIQLRKANPAFGLGTFTDLGGSNPSVLSFVREFGDDIVICVNNLSRFPQPVELDLRQFEGASPIELLGGAQFPKIGELPYLLTVAGHGFYWLRIPRTARPAVEPAAVIEGVTPAPDGGEDHTVLTSADDTSPPTEEPT
jgi:maltose alpha-D-glucosyltransferase/alpha-amylase